MSTEHKRDKPAARALHVHPVESSVDDAADGDERLELAGSTPSHDHDPRTTTDPHDHLPRSTAHAHEHAHDHDHDHDGALGAGGFPHEKLDAYRVALRMAAAAKKVADQIPRGHRSIADHLLRASSNSVLLLAEGANRRGEAEKRQRFVESRGEVGEVAAAGDLVIVLELCRQEDAEELKRLAGRTSAMLTGLIARLA